MILETGMFRAMTELRSIGLRLLPLLALAAALLVAPRALAQSAPEPPADAAAAIRQINNLLPSVAPGRRAEDILLPALAEMESPPGALSDQFAAAFMTPSHPAWSAVTRWTLAAPQQAALEALKTITPSRGDFVFAMPYGDAADSRWIEAGLSVDFGEQQLLVAANHLHLDAFNRLALLVHAESTRLADAGQLEDGVRLQLHLARFTRMIADREFFIEKIWAMRAMNLAFERMRDLVFLYPEGMSDDQIRDFIRELDDRDFAFDRIRMPQADRVAALQLVRETIDPRGSVNASKFAPTMARLASSERPLQLFGQAGRWGRMAENHANWYDTLDRIQAVVKDYELRWGLDPHDRLISDRTERDRLDRARHALVLEAIPAYDALFEQRLIARTEIAGTRLSLGVVGFKRLNRQWPPTLFAIRGGSKGFVREIDADPFDPSAAKAAAEGRSGVTPGPFLYFVPVRDFRVSDRVDPEPFEMRVVLDGLGPGAPGDLVLQQIAEAASAVKEQFGTSGRAAMEALPQSTVDSMAAPIVTLVQELNGDGVNAENYTEKVDELPDDIIGISNPQRAEESGLPEFDPSNLSEAERRAVKIAMLDAYFSKDHFLDAMRITATGRPLTGEQKRWLLIAMTEASLDVASRIDRIAARAAADSSTEFTIRLGEDHFVLYSRGENGVDDRARSVGEGGDDYILWPPLISIVREPDRFSPGN
ncbi:MAG: hypothetical protein VYC34_11075 [Planctomycetota bacterium]|nr:hypothetical protein [Planctomycetota bacterium]